MNTQARNLRTETLGEDLAMAYYNMVDHLKHDTVFDAARWEATFWQRLADRLEQMTNWISVGDRLPADAFISPESPEVVLVLRSTHDTAKMVTAVRYDGVWELNDLNEEGGDFFTNATHWRPLPSPPHLP